MKIEHALVKSLTNINDTLAAIGNSLLAPKSEWIVWQPFLGTFLGAGLAFASNYYLQCRKDKKDKKEKDDTKRLHQISEINSAIISFVNTTTTLLLLKKQIVLPFRADCISASVTIPIGLEEMERVLPTLSHLFKFKPEQVFNKTDYTEKLSFIAVKHPAYLQTFGKIRESLVVINDTINASNKFIERHMEQAVYGEDVTGRQMVTAIDMLNSCSDALELQTNCALWFIQLAAEHLQEYAAKYFPEERVLKYKIENNMIEYLPPKDYISGYRELMQESIQADIDNRNNKP